MLFGVLSIVLLLLLLGCTKVVPSAPTIVEKASSEAPSENKEPAVLVTVEQGGLLPSSPTYDSNISSLLELNKKVVSYRYTLDASKGPYYEIFVTPNFTKKVRSEPLYLKEEIYYDTVYLDYLKKTAIGVCAKPGITCSKVRQNAYPLNFEEESDFLTPFDTLVNLSYSAHKVGEEIIDGRSTVIVEQQIAQSKKERLWFDYYYGLPLKIVVYDEEKGKNFLLETHTFTRFIVGVPLDDVLLPDHYLLQE